MVTIAGVSSNDDPYDDVSRTALEPPCASVCSSVECIDCTGFDSDDEDSSLVSSEGWVSDMSTVPAGGVPERSPLVPCSTVSKAVSDQSTGDDDDSTIASEDQSDPVLDTMDIDEVAFPVPVSPGRAVVDLDLASLSVPDASKADEVKGPVPTPDSALVLDSSESTPVPDTSVAVDPSESGGCLFVDAAPSDVLCCVVACISASVGDCESVSG